jgi:hypothetical protein
MQRDMQPQLYKTRIRTVIVNNSSSSSDMPLNSQVPNAHSQNNLLALQLHLAFPGS